MGKFPNSLNSLRWRPTRSCIYCTRDRVYNFIYSCSFRFALLILTLMTLRHIHRS